MVNLFVIAAALVPLSPLCATEVQSRIAAISNTLTLDQSLPVENVYAENQDLKAIVELVSSGRASQSDLKALTKVASEKGRDWRLRAVCAWSLGASSAAVISSPLIRIVQDPEEREEVRRSAAMGLFKRAETDQSVRRVFTRTLQQPHLLSDHPNFFYDLMGFFGRHGADDLEPIASLGGLTSTQPTTMAAAMNAVSALRTFQNGRGMDVVLTAFNSLASSSPVTLGINRTLAEWAHRDSTSVKAWEPRVLSPALRIADAAPQEARYSIWLLGAFQDNQAAVERLAAYFKIGNPRDDRVCFAARELSLAGTESGSKALAEFWKTTSAAGDWKQVPSDNSCRQHFEGAYAKLYGRERTP